MLVSIRTAVILPLAIAFVLAASGAKADLSWGFESGRGHNAQAIGTVSGLVFSTTSGGNMYYADINSGWYNVTSDNGKVYDEGEYFVSDDIAAYITTPSAGAKISFAYGTATYFTVGYSSLFRFTLEAYNSDGEVVGTSTGPENVKSKDGTGLQYLTVGCPDIAYVVLHDQGSFWMIDNIETDAPLIPEPASVVVLGMGLAGLMARRRRR